MNNNRDFAFVVVDSISASRSYIKRDLVFDEIQQAHDNLDRMNSLLVSPVPISLDHYFRISIYDDTRLKRGHVVCGLRRHEMDELLDYFSIDIDDDGYVVENRRPVACIQLIAQIEQGYMDQIQNALNMRRELLGDEEFMRRVARYGMVRSRKMEVPNMRTLAERFIRQLLLDTREGIIDNMVEFIEFY
jgi:hypothetical protein